MSLLRIVTLAVLILASAANIAVAEPIPATPLTSPLTQLKVMTFNLRFASDVPPNAWSQRRPVVKACLRKEAPDVIGTQEGYFSQISDILTDHDEYSWIGLGREGGSHGETNAVLYRKDRLEPLEFDHFWLSDTPEVIASRTWGNTNWRMVTWVRFRDRQSGQQFYFWNTHFDHQIQLAREKSAALILQRIKALNSTLPIILVGDFNAVARENIVYELFTAKDAFVDTWYSAKQRLGKNVATAHGYKTPIPDGPHIDWILTQGTLKALNTHIVDYQKNGQYPSDHFPVMATLQIPVQPR